MLSHVEKATVRDSDTDSDYSIKTGDIQLLETFGDEKY